MKLNKDKIIEILNSHHFDTNNYIVISGAAMVLYGIKDDTDDIDIAVTDEYFKYLLNNYNCTFERVNEFNHEVYFIDHLINYAVDYYSDNYNVINGIHVQTYEDLIKLKEFLHRDKDKKDIKKIELLLKRR